jgi:osmotically-inducible protein OsmY
MKFRWAVTTVALGLLTVCGNAQQNPPAPDNTKINQGDQNPGQPTADQGKNNANDRDIMQKIRKSVMDEKSLSSYAHNVKIIAQNGKVTLRGPVRSEDEKQTIQQKAADVVGADNVANELTIKPARTQ